MLNFSRCGMPIVLLFSIGLLFISNILGSTSFAIGQLIAITIFAIMFLCEDLYKKITFAVFFVCLFTFNIAGAILPALRGKEAYSELTLHEFLVACNAMYISIIGITMGFSLSEKRCRIYLNHHHQKKNFTFFNENKLNMTNIKRLVFVIFITTTIVTMIKSYRTIAIIRSLGYAYLYSSSFSADSWINRLSIISLVTLMIGLATKPQKKLMYIYIICGFINPFMSLLRGVRGNILTYLLFVIFYLFSYSDLMKIAIDKFRKRRKIMRLTIVGIILLFFTPALLEYGHTRGGGVFVGNSNGTINKVFDFFEETGWSYNVIGYAERYKGKFPGLSYSLGPLIDFFKVNKENMNRQSERTALETNNFSHILAYTIVKGDYLIGLGRGSSFIAELYYDLGYWGVLLGSIFIGVVLNKIKDTENNSIFVQSIYYIVFETMLLMPRAQFLESLRILLSNSSIAIYFFVFFIIGHIGKSSAVDYTVLSDHTVR